MWKKADILLFSFHLLGRVKNIDKREVVPHIQNSYQRKEEDEQCGEEEKGVNEEEK